MNKAMRLLALAGMSLAVGATIGAGPVQAAPAGNQSTTGYHVQSWGDDYSYVVGHFRREWACKNAGWTGVKFGAWDKFRCDPIRVGWKRWVWELEVRQQYWNWNDWNGWPGAWPNKPDFHGHPFDIGKPYKPKPFPWKDKGFPWDGPNGPDDLKGNPWNQGPNGPPDIKGNPWNQGPNGPPDIKGNPWNQDPKGPHDLKGNPWNQGPKGPHDIKGNH